MCIKCFSVPLLCQFITIHLYMVRKNIVVYRKLIKNDKAVGEVNDKVNVSSLIWTENF